MISSYVNEITTLWEGGNLQPTAISILYFFITVWGGSDKILGKIKWDIKNYLWSGKE